jgi:hypothetical protein
MEEFLVELAEPIAILIYAALSIGLTGVGLVIEYIGLSGSHVGTAPRAWVLYMGAVIVGFGLLIARDKLWPVIAGDGLVQR